MKTCTRCKKSKSEDMFYKSRPTRCKTCISEQSKENYRKKNPKIYWEKCKSDEERKARRSAQFKSWLEKNREYNTARAKQWREENEEHRKEYNRKNRDVILANTRKRQVRKKVQTPDLCQMERDMIKALYFISKVLSNSCSYNFNVDHIMPISKGGLHTYSNLQILTEHENKSKGNKTWQ